MKRHLLRHALVFAYMIAAPLAVTAQVAFSPTPLPQNDPRTALVRAFVAPLLAGDRTAAVTYLSNHAAPGTPAASDAPGQVAAITAALGTGERQLIDVIVGPEGKLVALLGGPAGMLALEVEVDDDPPHRIRSIEPRQLNMRRQD